MELAPVDRTEKTPAGGVIQPAAKNGRWVPVVLVHGWTDRATHPNTDGTARTRGAFSHRIDMTANKVGTADVPRSLVGQLQGVPGAAVFTFDYYPYSGRWVTDRHLGPALGKLIDCLAKASGEKVIIVGHSMGGLIARYAASTPDRTAKIGQIVTLGTPNDGSLAALLTAVGVDVGAALSKPIAVVRLILSACGQVTTSDRDAGLCGWLPGFVGAFDGQAGRALRFGSAELRALPKVPAGIPVEALTGATVFTVPKNTGWFANPWDLTDVPVGDVVVTEASATAGASSTARISCAYQLSAARGLTDSVGRWLRVTADNDVAGQPLGAFSGPCFHANLMRTIELSNLAMGEVAAAVARAIPRGVPAFKNVGFATPSGNIVCWIHDANAFCTVTEHVWTAPKPPPAECEYIDYGSYLAIFDGKAQYSCTGGEQESPAYVMDGRPPPSWFDEQADLQVPLLSTGTLAYAASYGTTITNGKITCSVAPTGVRCTNTSSGAYFDASKDNVTVENP